MGRLLACLTSPRQFMTANEAGLSANTASASHINPAPKGQNTVGAAPRGLTYLFKPAAKIFTTRTSNFSTTGRVNGAVRAT